MTQHEIYKELDRVYTKLQRFDELHEHNVMQRQEVEKLERRASELEAMKH